MKAFMGCKLSPENLGASRLMSDWGKVVHSLNDGNPVAQIVVAGMPKKRHN